jgi:hypothetical protein
VVAQGLTNSEIADKLYIALSTVKTHIASLMAKLGARNRVEIAMWAYETNRVHNRYCRAVPGGSGHILPKLSNSPFRTPPRNACHSSDVNRRTGPSESLLLHSVHQQLRAVSAN